MSRSLGDGGEAPVHAQAVDTVEVTSRHLRDAAWHLLPSLRRLFPDDLLWISRLE